MENLNDFFHMGGHGPYIWSAYFITFAVLGIYLVITRRQYRQARVQATRAQHAKSQRADASDSGLSSPTPAGDSP